LSGFLKLRKAATTIFVSTDFGGSHTDSGGISVNRIEPYGKERVHPDKVDLRTDLDWSIIAPKDGQYSEILLEAGTFHGDEFIIEDFGLNSPHAWKRMF
jgi:hypothetical protein